MKMGFIFLSGLSVLLLACGDDGRMYEATCTSRAQSARDGVLLAAYQVHPAHIQVGEDFRLDIEDAFVEQRFMTNLRTGQVRVLDSTTILPKLVLVSHKRSETGVLRVDYDMVIVAVGRHIASKEEGRVLVNKPGNNLFAFNLKPVSVFIPQPIKIDLKVQGKHGTKHVSLTAKPVQRTLSQ